MLKNMVELQMLRKKKKIYYFKSNAYFVNVFFIQYIQ